MPAMVDAPIRPYQHHNARRVEPMEHQRTRGPPRSQQQDMMFERNTTSYSRHHHVVIPDPNTLVERTKTYSRFQRDDPDQDMAERVSQASTLEVCSDKELFASRRSSAVSSRRSSLSDEYGGQVEEERGPSPNQTAIPNGTVVTEEDGTGGDHSGGDEGTAGASDDRLMLLRMFGVLYGLLMFTVGVMLPAAQLFSADISQATVEAFYLYLFLVGAVWMGAVHVGSIMAARGGKRLERPDSTVNTYLTGAASFFGFCTILISAFTFGTYVYSDVSDPAGACDHVILAVTPVSEAVFTLFLVHHLWHHAWNNRTRPGKLHLMTSFGVMHTVATCGCSWIRTIIIEAWIDVKRLTPDPTPTQAPPTNLPAAFGFPNCSVNGTVASVTAAVMNTSTATSVPGVVRRSVEDEVEVFNFTESANATNVSDEASMDCLRERAFLTSLDPVLYPSNVEFYVISVGLILVLWSKMADGNDASQNPPRRWSMEKSNGGTVLSFLLFVVTICVIVLYHNDPRPGSGAFVVYYAHRIVLLVTMTTACVFTCVRRRRPVEKGGWVLDPDRDNRLGMIVILLCVAPIYFRDLLTVVAAIFVADTELVPGIVLMEALLDVVLVTTQSAVVLDTLSRTPPTAEFCPDLTRQSVVFLVLCNASLFAVCTNDAKDDGTDLVQIEYFGAVTWSVLRNIVQPFVILYRFYCSVSFMEVWLRG